MKFHALIFENIIQENNKILNFQDPIYSFKAVKGKRNRKY